MKTFLSILAAAFLAPTLIVGMALGLALLPFVVAGRFAYFLLDEVLS